MSLRDLEAHQRQWFSFGWLLADEPKRTIREYRSQSDFGLIDQKSDDDFSLILRQSADVAKQRMSEPNDPPSAERVAETALLVKAFGLKQVGSRAWRGQCPLCHCLDSMMFIATAKRVAVTCDSGQCEFATLESFIAGKLAHDGIDGFEMGRDWQHWYANAVNLERALGKGQSDIQTAGSIRLT